MAAVIDSLRQEHGNLAKLLTMLDREIAVFDSGEAPDYEMIGAILEYIRGYSDVWHHPKEDLVWRKIQDRDPATAATVGNLIGEHEKLDKVSQSFADAVDEVLAQEEVPRERFTRLARDFVDTTRRHMGGEETVFFPAALRVLTAEDWADIAMAMASPDDPLFGDRVEKRFEALRSDIMAMDRDGARA